MVKRDFSDSVKLSTITENMRKNNGDICCAICGTKLLSINECHFDHIIPFAKEENLRQKTVKYSVLAVI